jgi:hypothetical protein
MAELDAMIAKIQSMSQLAKRAAPDAAEAVREGILETIQAGTDPEGKAWAPRKADGGRPLAGAAGAVKAGAVGTSILVRISGPEARHHLGRGRGGTVRGVIPTTLTPRLAKRVRDVLVQHFDELVKEG